MKEFLYPFIKSIIESDYALVGLFVVAFAESSFFPIPPDTLMIPMALVNPGLALWYGFVTTVGSVLGGMFGYVIGARGGKPVVKKIIADEKLQKVKEYYHKWDVWAVSMAAFTPIPYKVFTIAAGLFDLNFYRFVLASALGRGGRFFLVGGLIFIFGPSIKAFLDSYFEITIIGFTILLIGGFWIFNKFMKKDKKNDNTSSTTNTGS